MEDALSYLFFISIAFAFVIFIAVLIGLDKNKTNSTSTTNRESNNTQPSRTPVIQINKKVDIENANDLKASYPISYKIREIIRYNLSSFYNSGTIASLIQETKDLLIAITVIEDRYDVIIEFTNDNKSVFESIALDFFKKVRVLIVKELKEEEIDEDILLGGSNYTELIQLYSYIRIKTPTEEAKRAHKLIMDGNKEEAFKILKPLIKKLPDLDLPYDMIINLYTEKNDFYGEYETLKLHKKSIEVTNGCLIAQYIAENPDMAEEYISALLWNKAIIHINKKLDLDLYDETVFDDRIALLSRLLERELNAKYLISKYKEEYSHLTPDHLLESFKEDFEEKKETINNGMRSFYKYNNIEYLKEAYSSVVNSMGWMVAMKELGCPVSIKYSTESPFDTISYVFNKSIYRALKSFVDDYSEEVKTFAKEAIDKKTIDLFKSIDESIDLIKEDGKNKKKIINDINELRNKVEDIYSALIN
ncbi:MAG: hypothetical protein GX963_10050 [Bacteroidales bacterium]|nr:hypothetical protein [Bacteroidales bacterium]